MLFRHLVAAVLILAGPVAVASAEEQGLRYRRSSKPHFSSKTIRGEQTRLVFAKLDIRNNTLTAHLVRRGDVLYGVEFTFAAPPEELTAGHSFELPASMRLARPGSAGFNADWIRLRYDLTPAGHFTTTGYPHEQHPTDLTLGQLRSAGRTTDLDATVTQTLQVRLQANEAKTLDCGYRLRLAWDDDVHEIQVRYEYRRGKGWLKKINSRDSTISKPGGIGAVDAGQPTISTRPWSEQQLVGYFSEYLANLNGSIRSARGVVWSIDAWGREVGPDTTLSVIPDGSWKNPNHYLWERNRPYEFYSLTIREYVRARLDGSSVEELHERGRAPRSPPGPS